MTVRLLKLIERSHKLQCENKLLPYYFNVKTGVKVILSKVQISGKISQEKKVLAITDIINNQYVFCTKCLFLKKNSGARDY